MPLSNPYFYTKTVVDGDAILRDHGNHYQMVAQKPYKGKPEKNLPSGTTVTLMVMEDHARPSVDQKTGQVRDNNVFQTFDATIPGATYPLPFAKGDEVSLGGFLPELSYYIKFNLILRFQEIRRYTPPNGGSSHDKEK